LRLLFAVRPRPATYFIGFSRHSPEADIPRPPAPQVHKFKPVDRVTVDFKVLLSSHPRTDAPIPLHVTSAGRDVPITELPVRGAWKMRCRERQGGSSGCRVGMVCGHLRGHVA
jgi:hypothetical protein